MKPTINSTAFGSITISNEVFDHDVVIRRNGKVKKRKKKLSKEKFGTSHMISLNEAIFIFDEGAKKLIIGTGQSGFVELSDEAAEFFDKEKCTVQLLSTPEAIKAWNKAEGATIGMFHVTC